MESAASEKPIRLGIGLPAYGGKISMWQAEQWLMMGYALAGAETRFTLAMIDLVDVCGIEVARNRLMADAIEKNVDWLFMTDTDTWYADGFDILQMISTADREGAAVVAVPTPRRGAEGDAQLMVYRLDPSNGDELGRIFLTKEDLDPKFGPLVNIDAAGTAMIAINVNFVKKHFQPPWFRFDWSYGSLNFVSEDFGFCRRVREAGGKLMATTAFVAHHMQRPSFL